MGFLVEGGADPEAILFIAADEGGTRRYFQQVGSLPDDLRHPLPQGVFTPLGLARDILVSAGAVGAKMFGLRPDFTYGPDRPLFDFLPGGQLRPQEQIAEPRRTGPNLPPISADEGRNV